jgi:reactive intermediate/imine deaminase
VKHVLDSNENPDVLGPYSHGTANETLVCTAGQIPITPAGVVRSDESIAVQTTQSLSNIERILADGGLSVERILKTTVYTTNIAKIDDINESYQQFFDTTPPARTTVEVTKLAGDADIEIEAIARNE